MLRRTARRLRSDDTGVALILVVALSAIVLLLSTVALSTSMAASRHSRNGARWVSALPAAQAGADDYLHRLNVDNNYFMKGNDDATNPALTNWVAVPGSPTKAQFRYRVLSAPKDTLNDGTIRLRASGRVDSQVRTIEVTYRKQGYLDYLYYSDKETTDPVRYPELYGVSAADAASYCDKYFPNRSNGCRDIQFRTGDLLDGPVGSNDAILMSGVPKFTDVVSTGWNDAGGHFYRAASGDYSVDTPDFDKGAPQLKPPYVFPPANLEIRREADYSIGGKGCLYTGPTLITLVAGGRMHVTSPYTKKTGPGCGDFSSVKHHDNLDLPANGVIYVQGIPADPKDPNYDPDGASEPCPSAPLLDGKYPDKDEFVFGGTYDCRAGDAWVQGKLRGQLTIAAGNDVVVVDDLEYENSEADNVLGLIATNNVEVYHPVECTSASSTDPKTAYCRAGTNQKGASEEQDITVEAAIFALQHSFTVQNYNVGAELGKLTVHGAIIQRFRGAVGTSSSGGGTTSRTGYLKDYHYDRRLQYLQPPYFLNPEATSWSARSFSECKGGVANIDRRCDGTPLAS